MSAALIAPAGAGKTALLRRLVAELPEARYQVSYVKVTSLSKRDLCRRSLGHP
jgi:molybdopterin-guanine dinucleotide biosynthesis protein